MSPQNKPGEPFGIFEQPNDVNGFVAVYFFLNANEFW